MLGWLNTIEAFQKTGTTIPLNLKVSVLPGHHVFIRIKIYPSPSEQ